MKKYLIVIAVMSVTVVCKSKKSGATTASTEPTDVQLQAVKAKYPDATMETLVKGHSIYYAACTKCHGAKHIERESEQVWVKIMDRMAPKAKLTPEEKDAVWKSVMGVK